MIKKWGNIAVGIILSININVIGQTTLSNNFLFPTEIELSETNIFEFSTNFDNPHYVQSAPSCSRNYAGIEFYFSFTIDEYLFPLTINSEFKNPIDHGISLYLDSNYSQEIECGQAISSSISLSIIDTIVLNKKVYGRIWINDTSDITKIKLFIQNTANSFAKVPVIGVQSMTPEQIVNNVLISGCVQAFNIQFTGHPEAIGYFTNGVPGLDFNSGIILSTGKAVNAAGPNNSPAKSTNFQYPGDALLSSIINRQTFDASILEFDFIPAGNTISFQYVFGSKEYEEYVGGHFNDIFAFHISGGPENYSNKNLAIIPGTNNTPVSINNVNHIINTQYYRNNDNGPHLQFDGYTVTLTASTSVTPCETYHIRLSIADAADAIFDSGVFIKAGSFVSGTMPLVKNVNDWLMVDKTYEGCENNLIFARSDNYFIEQPITFNITISGSATPTEDYSPLPTQITIPAGQEYIEIPYTVFADGIFEGEEEIKIKIFTGCQCGIEFYEYTVRIFDEINLSGIITDNSPKCSGETINANLSINNLPEYYQIVWNTGHQNTTNISFSAEESFMLRAEIFYPCGVEVVEKWIDILPRPQANFFTNSPVCEGQDIVMSASNGISYFWKGPNGFNSTEESVILTNAQHLQSGTYGLTVTGENGCKFVKLFDVQINEWPNPQLNENYLFCERDNINISTGNFYSYFWSGPNNWSSQNNALIINQSIPQLSGTYYLTVSDEIGCTGSSQTNISINPSPTASIIASEKICYHDSFTLSGNISDINYWILPDGNIINSDLFLINQAELTHSGTYTYHLQNSFGCRDSASATITVIYPDATILSTGPYCADGSVISLQSQFAGGIWLGEIISDANSASVNTQSLNTGFYQVVYYIGFPGCEDSDTVLIYFEQIPQIQFEVPQQICNSDHLIQLNAYPEGGFWENQGIINPTEGILNPQLCTPGSVYFTYTFSTATCNLRDSVNIQILNSPQVQITNAPEHLCVNSNQIYLTSNISGGIWSGTGIMNAITGRFNPSVAGVGTHTIYYTVQNESCIAKDSVLITVDDFIQAYAGNDISICNNIDFYNLPLDSNSFWTGPGILDSSAGIFSPSLSGTGTFPLVLTITNGACISKDTININVIDNDIVQVIYPQQVCMYDGSIFPQMNSNNLTFSGNGIINATTGEFNPAIAGEGIHQILYNYSNGECYFTDTLLINVLPAINPEFSYQSALCNDDLPVILTPINPGGIWSGDGIIDPENGVFDPSQANNLNIVSYSISNETCTSVSTAIIYVYNNSLNFELLSPSQFCMSDEEFELQVLPPGGNFIGPGIINNKFVPSLAGSGEHTITYSFGSGNCFVSIDFTLFVGDEISIDVELPQTICKNSDPILLPLSFENISWSGNAVIDNIFYPSIASTGNNTIFANIVINGCNQTFEYNIFVKDVSEPSITNVSYAYCQNYGYIYPDFYPENGVVNSTSLDSLNRINTYDLNPGIYQIIYTVENDGCSSSSSHIFEILPIPTPEIVLPSDNYCLNSGEVSIHTIPEGGWFQNIEISGNSFFPSTFGIGEHTILYGYSAPNGCTSYTQKQITIFEQPEISFEILNPVSCFGANDASVKAITNVPAEIFWIEEDSIISTILSNASAGWHKAMAISEFGCTTVDSINIDSPAPLNIQISGTQQLQCPENANAILTANCYGGNAPYNYQWNTGHINPTITELSVGEYSLTVTDNNLCSEIASFTILPPDTIQVEIFSKNPKCYGYSDGEIEIITNTQNSSIVWNDNNSTSFLRENLIAANYSFEITYNNVCKYNGEVTLAQPEEIKILATVTDVNCENNFGSILISVTGGTEPYEFLWNNGENLNFLENIPAGVYELSVTDSNNCVEDTVITILANGNLTVNIQEVSPIKCYDGTDGKLIAVTENNDVEYLWSTGEASQQISDLPAGTYSVTISDTKGCTGTTEYTLQNPNPIIREINTTPVRCFAENNGEIRISVNLPESELFCIWKDGAVGLNRENLYSGTYYFTISDTNGCSVSDSVFIEEPEAPLSIEFSFSNPKCHNSNDGQINAFASGGIPPYYFEWKFKEYSYNDSKIINLPAGTYSLTVSDSNDCKTETTITLEEPEQIKINAISFPVSCNNNPDGKLIIKATGGLSPYIYRVNNRIYNDSIIENLPPGLFTIKSIDSNNCSSDEISVSISDSELECLIIPNAFTPNGDGINDTWEIQNIELYQDVTIQVYNRWGQIVYETCSPSQKWDGTSNSHPLPSGTYLYIIFLNNGKHKIQGSVSILK
ncbi:MAG TPA: choice-of-anchor L domain-containing protein [Bacteroidales bacterium]|nr:choice-of-anchor L domain-containing protein [Bacteroidales bacterium]